MNAIPVVGHGARATITVAPVNLCHVIYRTGLDDEIEALDKAARLGA